MLILVVQKDWGASTLWDTESDSPVQPAVADPNLSSTTELGPFQPELLYSSKIQWMYKQCENMILITFHYSK